MLWGIHYPPRLSVTQTAPRGRWSAAAAPPPAPLGASRATLYPLGARGRGLGAPGWVPHPVRWDSLCAPASRPPLGSAARRWLSQERIQVCQKGPTWHFSVSPRRSQRSPSEGTCWGRTRGTWSLHPRTFGCRSCRRRAPLHPVVLWDRIWRWSRSVRSGISMVPT